MIYSNILFQICARIRYGSNGFQNLFGEVAFQISFVRIFLLYRGAPPYVVFCLWKRTYRWDNLNEDGIPL